MAEYEFAEEVKGIAEDLIENYHGNLQGEANIAYIFRDPPIKKKGDVVLGKASKISGKYEKLTGLDFVIEISKEPFQELEEKQKKALIDHELSHCWIDIEGKRKILNHDFEGFTHILKRYGYWDDRLKNFKKKMDQMKLPFDEEKPELELVGK